MIQFDLKIPFIHIHTSLINQCCDRLVYHYVAWHFEIWKWHWIFEWGKTREEILRNKNNK